MRAELDSMRDFTYWQGKGCYRKPRDVAGLMNLAFRLR